MSLISPALAGGLFTPSSTWEACFLEALSVIWMIIMVTEYLMCVLGWHDPCSSLDCCTGKSVYNRGLRSEETASGKPNGWGVLSLTLWLPVSFAKSFSFSFQIFPSKWELSRGDVAVVKAFVSVLLLWLLSSLRFSLPHGTGSILSMFVFFWIRKLWSNLLKVTQLVRSKVGLRPASSPPAQRFPALLITLVAAGAGRPGSQVMPVDCGSCFLRGMSSGLDEKRWG